MNIVGRITKNAEITVLKNEKQVVNFSVAINDSYKTKQGERKGQTTFYNCSYWISPNIAKSLTKGTLVELTGRASSSAWIGKGGELKSGLNFHTSNIKFHSTGKRMDDIKEAPKPKAKRSKAILEEEKDDLPF